MSCCVRVFLAITSPRSFVFVRDHAAMLRPRDNARSIPKDAHMPTRKPSLAANPDLLIDLVAANRILAMEGVLDGYGHVSVRSDRTPGHFFMSRSLAPPLVTVADIMEHGADSEPVRDDRKGYLERYIHGEVYRQRPDVMAVVHSHSDAGIPL